MHAADLLSTRAHLTPDREALLVVETGERFTYAELNTRACRLANFLQTELGVGKGDRVSILAQNGIETLDLFYGLAKLGAIFAPLNWRLTGRELEYIVNDLEPKVLLASPEYADLAAELGESTPVPHLVGLDGPMQPGARSYREVAGGPGNEPDRPPISPDDPHCILYTSGTTGKPKGALIPHRQVLWNCINTVISWGLTEKDVSPVYTPLFHAGGLFAFLTPILYAGGRIVLARGFDPDESLRTIEAECCTVILGVPTLFRMWRESESYRAADFSRVHFFINGGAAIPLDLMQAWRDEKSVVFRQGYGLTEVGPNCFTMTDEESERISGSVGQPVFHSRMRLVDPETLADVPDGAPGELLIAGSHVSTGYWRNPTATAEALVQDPGGPWFRTGDTARCDENGNYTIIGRYKDMIKSGGENVYAAEVEAVFRSHSAVADCALIGAPDERWGEVGVLVVVLANGASATPGELLDFCAGQLARFKIPKEIVVADALPYSPYGKVEKVKLKEMYLE